MALLGRRKKISLSVVLWLIREKNHPYIDPYNRYRRRTPQKGQEPLSRTKLDVPRWVSRRTLRYIPLRPRKEEQGLHLSFL